MEELRNDIQNIKSKVIEQINNQHPKEKAKEFTDKIEQMEYEEFISFLKQQGLIKEETGKEEHSNCLFCAIVSKQIPSTKLVENEDALAILELNPISKGHSLIIPKKHITKKEDFPEKGKELAKFIAEELTRAFKPKRIDFAESNIMGHEVLNVIPVYNEENINSKREKRTPEELIKTKEEIENSKPKIIEKEEEPKESPPENLTEEMNEKNTWLPKRFP